MPRRIQLQNHQDESKTLYIEHPFSLDKCMCIDSEDDDCVFYSVGYDLKDLCTSLALDVNLPVYVAGPSCLRLEVIDENGANAIPGHPGKVVLVPVHRNTPLVKLLRN